MTINFDSLRTIINSKVAHIALYVLGALFFTVAVFQAGMEVGFRKAAFSYRGAENFERLFGERGGMIVRGGLGGPGEFQGTHGAAGQIVSVQLPTVVVAGPDGIERIVRIGEGTEIRRFRDTIEAADLQSGDMIAVLGAPNDEFQIEARLIRILPPRSGAQISTTTGTRR